VSRLVIVAVVLLLTASATVAGARSLRLPAPLTLYGVAGVRPGMTPAQVRERWGIEADTPGPGFNGCTGAAFQVGALHGVALFERHRFSSVTFDRGARTGNGIVLGAPLPALKRAYGSQLRSHRKPYSMPAVQDFFVRKPSRPYAWLYFSMKQGRVQSISYGNASVFYEEGCA
jgi:hypothetical protein